VRRSFSDLRIGGHAELEAIAKKPGVTKIPVQKAPLRTPWRPCQAGLSDIPSVIIGSIDSGVPESLPRRVFRFLKVPLQGLFGVLSGAPQCDERGKSA